jgi:exo-1,4-beta-D-glucosaminidase
LFDSALCGRYGPFGGLEDYVWKAQLACYEAERAMFEAYGRRTYRATGVIQWMLNNAWPSLIWHLWDHSLRTAGGYFGTKKACEPLHIQYDAGEETVSVVSDLPEASPELTARVRVFDLELVERHRHEARVLVPADGVVTLGELPDRRAFGRTHFLLLELEHPSGLRLSRNFYWLSSERDVIDHESSNWYMAPLRSYASFQALSELPSTELRLQRVSATDAASLTVRLHNAGGALAFFTQLRLLDRRGDDVVPAHFSDNYVSLLPGESMEVSVTTVRLAAAAVLEATCRGSASVTLRLG